MKSVIKFTKTDYDRIKEHLLQNNTEQAAFLLAGVSRTQNWTALLVKEAIPVPDEGFLTQSGVYLEIDPVFMAPIIRKARDSKLAVISLHSHPFSGSSVGFSGIDDAGEAVLMAKIQQRVPHVPHATMVFGQSSIDARIWFPGSKDPVPVDVIKIIGRTIREIYSTSAKRISSSNLSDTHNRQILAFGKSGQQRIQQATIGIVGLSGTGSHVFQQLVHLGVRKFVIIDKERMEDPNLSRTVGAIKDDVIKRSYKTEVMKNLATKINPEVEIQTISDSVEKRVVVLALRDVDVIFCCTDNLSSRFMLNKFVFQYLIPLIDMGNEIQLKEESKIRTAGGGVRVLTLDGPCLESLGITTPAALEREKQIKSGYVVGDSIADPSVISLNGVVSSLAVTEFIDLLTCFEKRKDPNTYQVYDILKGAVFRQPFLVNTPCSICAEIKGLGDNLELPSME